MLWISAWNPGFSSRSFESSGMVAVEPWGEKKKPPIEAVLVVLICVGCLVLVFSFLQSAGQIVSSRPEDVAISPDFVKWEESREIRSCNYSEGMWIRDPNPSLARYDNSCKEIFKGWNCISAGKSNAREITSWRWQPFDCDLLPLDPYLFLKRHQNMKIGFVGDSLNRNMFVSLICMLKRATSGEVKKLRPAGADRGFIFMNYNLTVAYHRTNLLVRYNRWSASKDGGFLESLGFKQGYRVDVDIPDQSWIEATVFHDILIFNSGHWWWAPSKFDPVKSPMLFFEGGKPLVPVLSPEEGFDLALKHMIAFVERTARNKIKFFRTQSPRHFEGGDWYQGGSCTRTEPLSPHQVEEMFAVERNGTNVEARLVNGHIFRALAGSGFRVLDVSHVSEFRADAHPAASGGKLHDDCMHWCLPGITDTWNDLFSVALHVTRGIPTPL